MISNGFKQVTKNIAAAQAKVIQNEQASFNSMISTCSRKQMQEENQKNPDRIWFVKEIGKCLIEKFEG